jgi:hypothetical protein
VKNAITGSEKEDSHFWAGLVEVKDLVLQRGRFRVQDGSQTRFWEDLWLGKDPLMVKYPSLYKIVRNKKYVGCPSAKYYPTECIF